MLAAQIVDHRFPYSMRAKHEAITRNEAYCGNWNYNKKGEIQLRIGAYHPIVWDNAGNGYFIAAARISNDWQQSA